MQGQQKLCIWANLESSEQYERINSKLVGRILTGQKHITIPVYGDSKNYLFFMCL
jgi:hypothetical protein